MGGLPRLPGGHWSQEAEVFPSQSPAGNPQWFTPMEFWRLLAHWGYLVPLFVAEAATARWPCTMAAGRLVVFLYVCSVLVTAPLSLRIPDPDLYGSPVQWVTSVVLWGMVLVLLSWQRKLKRLSAIIESKDSEYHMALDENEKLGERLGQILKEYEDTEDSLLAALLEKGALVGRFGAVGKELDFLV